MRGQHACREERWQIVQERGDRVTADERDGAVERGVHERAMQLHEFGAQAGHLDEACLG